MQYLLIIFGLLIIGSGCSPTPLDGTTTNSTDSLQFRNNISSLFGNGGKNAKDNTGLDTASNIIWKDSLGTTRSLTDLKGKIVLLNFWAIWCGPCEAEMPDLNSISETDIVVIAVSAIDPNSSLFQRTILYSETRGLKFQIITDQASKAYINYNGKDNVSIPRSFAINRDGHIVYTFIGQQTKKQFMDILNQIP